MPTYKLYYLKFRGIGEPIRLLLHSVQQDFEDCRLDSFDEVNQRKDEFPFGKVPVLEIDNNVKIAQSQAILRYLGKKFNLAGKDDVEAAIVDSLGYLFIDFHIAIRPFARCVAGYEQGDLETLTTTFLIPGIQQYMPMFEKALADSKSGYLVKSGLTWIDFLICETCFTMRNMFPDVFKAFPLLNQHVKRVYSLPTLQEYLHSRPNTPF